MVKYINKYDLLKATDEEINSFFREVKFTGMFDDGIPNEHKEKFCGQITNISMDGEQNNLCPPALYVPIKYATFVHKGTCEFVCYVILKQLRDENNLYRLQIARVKNVIIPVVKCFNSGEEVIFKRNLKLRDNLFIGQFTQNRDGSFTIRDIRRSDFSKLILQNGKEQQPIVYHTKYRKPEDGKYYEFSWVMNGVNKDDYIYLFKVDETKPFKEISARELINRLKDDIMGYPAGAGQKIVKMLDTLKNQLSASGKEIFIYELLQNANDYPNIEKGITEKVDVEFHITLDSLLFMHSGSDFNKKNIAAICSINDKEKTNNKDAIGYKGIGFKTVFLDNNYVYLQTGDFSFRFDKEETRDIVDTPWQILPIWTNYNELTSAEKYVFTNADKKFRVKFALHPTNKKTLRGLGQNYIKMFQDVFHNERVILFIPNLDSVKVYYNGKPTPEIVCLCDNDHWQVNDYKDDVPKDVTESINSDIDKQEDSGTLKIPTKYYDFTKTKVSFACEIEGSQLKEVEDTQLYCYLPTKATWGFKFLMNTDMIPTGPRDDIEIDFSDQININAEIAEIAGRKFFDWIKSLCELKRYKYNSIFRLIPVFETNIREHSKYKELIERFKGGFNNRLNDEEIIPIDGTNYEVLTKIILDETGLTSSGIISDEDFFCLSGLDGALPIHVLRKDREFNAFLRRYLKELNFEDNIWTIEDLKALCKKNNFQNWVKIQENNNKFLNFLLEKGYLKDFLDEEIFLEVDGGLYKADELIYDINKYIIDLQAFTKHIYYLSPKTREHFKGNEKWNQIITNSFVKFDCDKFVDDVLLASQNKSETIGKLKDKETSIHFYKFLAENVGYSDKYLTLPFINDTDEDVDDFEDKFIFFSSKKGHEVCESDWMSDINIQFLSDDYLYVTKNYFKDNFEVTDYSDEIIVKDIILSEDYHDNIADTINGDINSSKAFIDYCYVHKDFFDAGSLRNYSLHVYDSEGEEQWCLTEDHIYFQSNLYDEYSSKEWLNNGWMYVLDEDYFNAQNDVTDFRNFLSLVFWVEDLSKRNFYEAVVKNNFKEIFYNTSRDRDMEGSKNIDFIAYLDDNYHLIFEEEKDNDVFGGLLLVSKDFSNVKVHETNLYIYNEELVTIVGNDWFPKDSIYICNKAYGKSKALSAIGVKSYKFGEFFDDVIVSKLNLINDNIDDKDTNITFHNFIIDRMSSLTADQQYRMLDVKVFLYGQNDAATTSGGHKILSTKAKELFELGLVEFSHLDIIDLDYNTEKNKEYWETRLGNTKFTVDHFFSWLKENNETFTETLNDEDLNVKFWRWLKDNMLENHVTNIPNLPLLLKDGSVNCSTDTVYFSDEYMDGAGIEHSVKTYDEDALFISPKYIDGDKHEWKNFWSSIGVKCKIVDILVEAVIPNLAKIEDEGLSKLIAENKEALELVYEGGLVKQLTDLKIKAHDGEFYEISETIYIDCEKDEPFPYIKLPNQISFSSAEERRLIKEIIDEVDGDCVSALSEWQQRKLDYYLTLQDDNQELVRKFHYRFINDLSFIRNNKKENLKDLVCIEGIYLLDKEDEFRKASELTMGSVYNPFFDFETCGVESFDYVSDYYEIECSEYPGRLFRDMHIHCDIQEDDISLLENRMCAVYFWGKYLLKKDISISKIRGFISKNLLDDIECIPTKDYMKKPKELYSGYDVSKYIKTIEDWENKIPLKDLPVIKLTDGTSLFENLTFKNSLDFLDALYALITITGQDRRTQLLNWMIDDYDESYDAKIKEYREDEHALWNNNKNESIQIKELYALDYWDKTLDQYFGTNPKIINKLYLPTGDFFKRACEILCIKTITEKDLRMEPIGVSPFTTRDKDLRLFALVIAGIGNTENWANMYADYCEKLESLTLHRCKSITITYREDENISQSLKAFYHETGSNDFFFVNSLTDGRVYLHFVKEFSEFLGISNVNGDLLETIMYSAENALEFVKEQNTLMLDEVFKDELDKIIPGIKRELLGNEAEKDDDDSITYRPTFTTNTSVELSDDNQDDIKTDQYGAENITETYSETSSHSSTKQSSNSGIISTYNDGYTSDIGSGEDDDSEGDENETSTRKQRSDKGVFHGYPSELESRERKPKIMTINITSNGKRSGYSDMSGWEGNHGNYTPKIPKPFSPDDVRNFGSNGLTRTLEVLEPTTSEVDEINRILGGDLTPEQVADQNYLAQLRLYNNLKSRGMAPDESKGDFIKNAHMKNTHTIGGSKYIHKCSAAGGIMYLSPSIWNKLADERCVVCVYLGAKANEFMYFNSLDDILKWIGEDDIVIKLTGEEKAAVVEELYSGVLDGVKGSAYTMIRINSNEKYNSVFAPISNISLNEGKEDGDEY